MDITHTICHSSVCGADSAYITNVPPQSSTVWGKTVSFANQVGNFLSKKLEQSSCKLVAIYLRIASIVTSGRSDIPSPDSYSFIFKQQLKEMRDADFFTFHLSRFTSNEISDKDLLLTPNIDQHSEVYRLSPEKINIWFKEFMRRDLETKRYTTHKGLTESQISFMMKQDPFIKAFTENLRKGHTWSFYSKLAHRALMISRGNPTSEDPLGAVQLSSIIISSNQSILNNLSAEVDRSKKPVEDYIQYLNNYSSTEEPLSYVQWQCPECNPGRRVNR